MPGGELQRHQLPHLAEAIDQSVPQLAVEGRPDTVGDEVHGVGRRVLPGVGDPSFLEALPVRVEGLGELVVGYAPVAGVERRRESIDLQTTHRAPAARRACDQRVPEVERHSAKMRARRHAGHRRWVGHPQTACPRSRGMALSWISRISATVVSNMPSNTTRGPPVSPSGPRGYPV